MSSSITAPASAANDDTKVSAAPLDQDQLSVDELAERLLAREFRPRVASVMRLAGAVLARTEPEKSGKAGGKKKSKGASGKAGKKAGGKKRKLARIPGQKDKKKA